MFEHKKYIISLNLDLIYNFISLALSPLPSFRLTCTLHTKMFYLGNLKRLPLNSHGTCTPTVKDIANQGHNFGLSTGGLRSPPIKGGPRGCISWFWLLGGIQSRSHPPWLMFMLVTQFFLSIRTLENYFLQTHFLGIFSCKPCEIGD